MSIHICHTPMHVVRTWAEPERWCFGCRKRTTGTWTLSAPDDIYSYYGPTSAFKCDRCHKDRRLGFGLQWEPWDY